MWGKVACLLGMHDWSEWRPVDPENPRRQIRSCARCPREKFNDASVPIRWQDNPPSFLIGHGAMTGRSVDSLLGR
jgi:hypothetical protein